MHVCLVFQGLLSWQVCVWCCVLVCLEGLLQVFERHQAALDPGQVATLGRLLRRVLARAAYTANRQGQT